LTGGEGLLIGQLLISDMNWVSMEPSDGPFRAEVRVRHSKVKYPALVLPNGEEARIVFDSPIRRPSAGQSAVAYGEGAALCGGFIVSAR
jgi:tRNA-specific 2-thiouridylase